MIMSWKNKLPVLPEMAYKFTVILVKISVAFSTEIKKCDHARCSGTFLYLSTWEAW